MAEIKPLDVQHLAGHLFAPIVALLDAPDCTELVMNRPDSVWIEKGGQWQALPEQYQHLFDPGAIRPAFMAANSFNKGNLAFETPLLSGSLPSGERIQIVIPPASEHSAFAIRKPGVQSMDLDMYEAQGAFNSASTAVDKDHQDTNKPKKLRPERIKHFLIDQVKARKTIIISGGTSTGKTTFFNALAQHIDKDERLITIEDTREIKLLQPNSLHLLTQREATSYGFTELLQAALRLRPDRIFAAELRGAEAFAFLRSVNTGHPGSMTTIHASSCEGAIQQLLLMLSQANTGLPSDTLERYIRMSVDMIIQLKRDRGRRYIDSIYFDGRLIEIE